MYRGAGPLSAVTAAGSGGRRCASRRGALVPLLALVVSPTLQAAGCTLGRLAQLPVTMEGLQPMVRAGINGRDVQLIADTGAVYSVLTPAAAAQLNLHLEHAPFGVNLKGVGGEAELWLTNVKTFNLFNVAIPNVVFLVGGNDLGHGAIGLLGQNVFAQHDDEYDLANGMIRLFRPHDCKKVNFAYWAKGTAQPVSQIELEFTASNDAHTASVAYVNGARIRVLFDTGADVSVLSLDAAKRAGITPASPGVKPAGNSVGVGQRAVRTWVAPVASFRIGDEEIKNTRLRIGESLLDRERGDMLLGADFFLSHRIYVANSEHMLFFTYNGGPVFNLAARPGAPGTPAEPQPASPAAATAAATAAAAAVAADSTAGEPADAAAFARRGSAYAARHDYARAIADLNRACELAPGESAYFYQRGLAHLGNKDADAALSDFDQMIKLKPDDVPALLARAQLHLARHEAPPAVLADLDAADRAAARESDERITIGELYQRAGSYSAAVAQYSKWLDVHQRGDVRLAEALAARCWARAKWGQELDAALSDCTVALRHRPDFAGPHDGRGLIYLRRGDYDHAISEYDAALHLNPRIVWALYGRGIAKLHKGKAAEGQADLDAATAIAPRIAEEAAQCDIRP